MAKHMSPLSILGVGGARLITYSLLFYLSEFVLRDCSIFFPTIPRS
jgi:hypothetical protein